MRKRCRPPNSSSIRSNKPESFVFDPPLPNLWSNYEIAPQQLVGTLDGISAQKLYDKLLLSFDVAHSEKVKSRKYGMKKNSINVPILSLGGMVGMRKSIRKNTRLLFVSIDFNVLVCCKCCKFKCHMKSQTFFLCNAVIVPMLFFFVAWINYLHFQYLKVSILHTIFASIFFPFCWLVFSGWMMLNGHQRHLDTLLNYAYKVGINHIETARGYKDSEAQLSTVLQRQLEKNHIWIVQTKVKPYKECGSFYKTSLSCMKTLGKERIDFLTIHGVNEPKDVETCIKYTIGELKEMKQNNYVQMVGFSGHGQTEEVLIKMIKLKVFDFINLHYGFFSSYTNIDNQSAVLSASHAGMGVYCISPSNKGGELHNPSKVLIDLCQPLHPLEFGLLYLMVSWTFLNLEIFEVFI